METAGIDLNEFESEFTEAQPLAGGEFWFKDVRLEFVDYTSGEDYPQELSVSD